MKLLLIHTSDYLHHPVPSRQHAIFEELSKRHEVHVAHFHVSREAARSTNLIVDEATLFNFSSPLFHYTLNAPYHYFIFNKIIRENNIDVVITSNVLASSAAILAAKKYKIPVIFDLSDWLPDSAAAYIENRIFKEIVRKAVWEITRMNLSGSDRIVTVSPSLVRKLAGLGFVSELITNGVDTDFFKPLDGGSQRKKLGISEDAFVIGFAGALERWYEIDKMLEAMPELLRYNSKIRLLVVGGGLFTGYEKELHQLKKDLGLTDFEVIFTGQKPYKELPEYIACMDICVIPLAPPQWGDIALPNKYFEYSACNKPILMRPMPSVEAMGGKHLLIYRNNQEYVQHIKNMLRNPVKVSLDINEHSWTEKAKQFEQMCEELMSRKTSR